jgi:hypothetical protein
MNQLVTQTWMDYSVHFDPFYKLYEEKLLVTFFTSNSTSHVKPIYTIHAEEANK